MDSSLFNIVDVCTGIGGLSRGVYFGLKSIGFTPRTVCYVEREAFACAVLDARMEAGDLDAAPIWTDVSSFPCRNFTGSVDMVIGGIPCQDFSLAGKCAGTSGDRWLWPDFWRIVCGTGAKMLFLENVAGFVSGGGLAAVVSDLAASGWNAEWDCFSADEVGAPHRRERLFVLAYAGCEHVDIFKRRIWAKSTRESCTMGNTDSTAGLEPQRKPGGRAGVEEANQPMAHSAGKRRSGRSDGDATGSKREIQASGSRGSVDCNRCRYEIPTWPPCPEDEAWERVIAMRPDLAPAINGKLNPRFVSWLMGLRPDWVDIPGAAKVDQLRALGNSCVPATAELALRTLWHRVEVFNKNKF